MMKLRTSCVQDTRFTTLIHLTSSFNSYDFIILNDKLLINNKLGALCNVAFVGQFHIISRTFLEGTEKSLRDFNLNIPFRNKI